MVLPGLTPDSSRYMPVRPGSTMVRPGVAPVHHGSSRFVGQSITSSANAATMSSHTWKQNYIEHVREYELAFCYFRNRGNT